MTFKKGQSGNPGGQPIEKPFLAALNRAIAQEDSKRLRKSAEKLLDAAAAGEPWAISMLADRTDGKPSQSIDQKTQLSGTVEVSQRPQLTKAEWLELHGLGTAGGAAK